MPSKKKIKNGSAPKRALRTAGAVKREKRSPQIQPEHFGHTISLARDGVVVRIVAGCRCFSFAEAKKHWAMRARSSIASLRRQDSSCGPSCSECVSGAKEARTRARNMLALLPTLKKRARSYGWLTATKAERR